MKENGIFIVRFQREEERDKVLQSGVFHFANKPLIVTPWSENSNYNVKAGCLFGFN